MGKNASLINKKENNKQIKIKIKKKNCCGVLKSTVLISLLTVNKSYINLFTSRCQQCSTGTAVDFGPVVLYVSAGRLLTLISSRYSTSLCATYYLFGTFKDI